MKKTVFTYLLFFVSVVVLNSCSRYEDGPFLSFRSKQARVEGLYHIKTVEIQPDTVSVPQFLENVDFEFMKEGGGHLSFYLNDTIVNSNFEWEFNDAMSDIRIRRFYMHRDTCMYLTLDSLYHICFNAHLPVYDNFQQAMYGNHNTWGEWGGFIKLDELSDEVMSYEFSSDSTDLSVKIVLNE